MVYQRSAANLLAVIATFSIAGVVSYSMLPNNAARVTTGPQRTSDSASAQRLGSLQGTNSVADQPILGIAKEKPEGPYFVELPNGTFMVPYTHAIPGTNVSFKMTPIPAANS